MSFGLLKHFKDRKTGTEVGIPSRHFRHLVVGGDLSAVLKLVEIRKNFPGETVKLISSRPLTRQHLLENTEYGVAMVRSPNAVEAIYRRHFNVRLSPQPKDALFYKDGKFHDFGSRAKPMNVLTGEEFFMSRGHRMEVAGLFEESTWENLDSLLNECLEIRILESVEKTIPQDLVEKNEWKLHFKDFSSLTCENLYLSSSPKKFLSLLQHKEKLTKELIDVCTSPRIQAGISVTWELSREVHPEHQTLFVPQSMTHEWGHFIVEFESFDHAKDQQLCHVLFLIHEDEPQSEDLAGKIKLMKRVLDRVFPDIEQSIKREFIRFDEEMFISGIKEEGLEQVGFDYPTLRFLGQMAPVSAEHSGEKFLARALLS